MAATADSNHPPPLGVPGREQLGHELQSILVELVGLSLLGKQLHDALQIRRAARSNYEGPGEPWSLKHRAWLVSLRFADRASQLTHRSDPRQTRYPDMPRVWSTSGPAGRCFGFAPRSSATLNPTGRARANVAVLQDRAGHGRFAARPAGAVAPRTGGEPEDHRPDGVTGRRTTRRSCLGPCRTLM
jgi:hypothetical protein